MTIHADNIVTHLGGTPILRGISLRIDQGEMIAIVGPNGSGKSTLLRSIAGVIPVRSGSVTIDARPLGALKKKQLAKRLGFLAQAADIPQLTTVEEHVALGRHAHRRRPWGYRGEDAEAIRSAMRTCQVERLARRRLSELSGGERQRVRLATLLAQNPGIMLLDEPLNGLDIEHQLAILELLRSVHTLRQKTVVCVLHDLELALRYFDRIVVLSEGRIRDDGPSERVLRPELFRSVFRVEGRVGREQSGLPVVVCQHPQCLARRPSPPSGAQVHVREGVRLSAATAPRGHAAQGPIAGD